GNRLRIAPEGDGQNSPLLCRIHSPCLDRFLLDFPSGTDQLPLTRCAPTSEPGWHNCPKDKGLSSQRHKAVSPSCRRGRLAVLAALDSRPATCRVINYKGEGEWLD